MQHNTKNKTNQKLGFRTSDHFKGQTFRGGQKPNVRFSATTFKQQHKG